jgi:pimeloyl-ACP methyl ester carboxylesterase
LVLAAALGVALLGFGGGRPEPAPAAQPAVRVWKIHYRAHNDARRAAYVVLPTSYGPKNNPPIPLIISPHGRGLTGRSNAALWGNLPAGGPFAVVNPDGQGRRLSRHSWGFAGQIEDLARMPEIVRRALPWLRVDRRRVYAFGGSMGGQETLLLLARYPRMLAGAAVFDSVTDLALQYRRFPLVRCGPRCRRTRGGAPPLGRFLQNLARQEIGGSPRTLRRAYAARSPATYTYEIAFSCVPLQMWWSVADLVVTDQQRQSGKLYWDIRRLNPDAPVHAFVGFWIHSSQMNARTRLPRALDAFGLLTEAFAAPGPPLRELPARAPSGWCSQA